MWSPSTTKAGDHGQRQRQRRVWPPPNLGELPEAKRLVPQHWRRAWRWSVPGTWGLVLLIACMMAPSGARAQQSEDITAGTLMLQLAHGRSEAPRVHTDVIMEVSGIIARVQVRQQFHNPTEEWAEGLYAFPLPDNSAVNRLHMQVGEREIVGEIREREQAQQIYEKARQHGQRATIVDQRRPNVFRTAVANIGPRETIVVTIAYLQVIDQQAGRYSVRFPLAITPRYTPGGVVETAAAVSGETRMTAASIGHRSHDSAIIDLQPRFAPADPSRQSVRFEISLNAGTSVERIESAYHPIDVAEQGDTYRIELVGGSVPPDRDFELAWTPQVLGGPAAALFRERTAAGEHVLLMFMPPQERTALAAPREVIFIIDTSGSMGGESIRQARASLEHGLASLTSADRFNVIRFDSSFEALFPGPVAASRSDIERARRYVRGLQASGGTEMLGALRAAFAMPRSAEHLRQIVFITDGAVSNETELMRAIEEEAGDARLFIVGIGSAPNGYFMRTAAAAGRGTFTFIGAGHEIEEKMDALLHKLTHPVLSDIELHWPGGVVPEYAPARIGDLYADEPLVVSARLVEPARGVLTISARAGAVWTRQLALDAAADTPGVSTLWARNRIAEAMSQQARGVSEEHIRAQVLPLALEYRLVSKYTSLVAVDKTPVRRSDEALRARRIDNTQPHGAQWTTLALPSTATAAPLHLMAGVLMLLLAGAWLASGRCAQAARS